jgi:phosphotransferase system enzyme I (PtsI)
MSPRAIPAVRAALAARTLADCRDQSARVLAAADPVAARGAAQPARSNR